MKGFLTVIMIAAALSGCATRTKTVVVERTTRTAPAEVLVVRPAEPPPRVEVIGVAPYHNAVWVKGHWDWRPRSGRYVWMPGHWHRH